MSTYIACDGALVVNADQTLSCDNWQQFTAQQILADAGVLLSPDDFGVLKTFIFIALIAAFAVRIVRNLFLAPPARG